MKDNNPGVLIKDFIKKHLKIEEDLQNRINELEEEIKKLKGSSDVDEDYLLYKEILKIISNSIQITYDSDGLYYLSMNPTSMNTELLESLLNELKKYKNKENPFDDVRSFDDISVDLIDNKGVKLNYGMVNNMIFNPNSVYPVEPWVIRSEI